MADIDEREPVSGSPDPSRASGVHANASGRVVKPFTTSGRLTLNLLAFGVLVGTLVAVHFVLAANPSATRSVAQSAVFSWTALAIIGGLGLLGAVLVSFTPIPDIWDSNASLRAKLLTPFAFGLGIGGAMVVGDVATGYSHVMAARMHLASIHISWPLSVPIYFGGAILVTIIYYFVVLPLLDLLAVRFLPTRAEPFVYWTAGLALAMVEPVTQGDFSSLARDGVRAAPNAVADILLNVLQITFLRRAGLLAAITVRIGCYAVWHVLYGLF